MALTFLAGVYFIDIAIPFALSRCVCKSGIRLTVGVLEKKWRVCSTYVMRSGVASVIDRLFLRLEHLLTGDWHKNTCKSG